MKTFARVSCEVASGSSVSENAREGTREIIARRNDVTRVTVV